jgi:hypothetical protein
MAGAMGLHPFLSIECDTLVDDGNVLTMCSDMLYSESHCGRLGGAALLFDAGALCGLGH